MTSRYVLLATCAIFALFAGCQNMQVEPQSKSKWTGTLPALHTLEDCESRNLSSYAGKTYRFSHKGCRANVRFDGNGEVTAFEPDDAEICRDVLPKCL